jgi:hypothetical protein
MIQEDGAMAQLWMELVPTVVGGLGGVLGAYFAESYLIGPDGLISRFFRR